MFNNIGNKIKGLAVLFTVIGIFASCILGFLTLIIVRNSSRILWTIFIIVVGCLLSWVGSFLLYGFGELVSKTTENTKINNQILLLLCEDKAVDINQLYSYAEKNDGGKINDSNVKISSCGARRENRGDKEEVSVKHAPLPKHISERLYVLNNLKLKNLISKEEYNKKVNEILAERRAKGEAKNEQNL